MKHIVWGMYRLMFNSLFLKANSLASTIWIILWAKLLFINHVFDSGMFLSTIRSFFVAFWGIPICRAYFHWNVHILGISQTGVTYKWWWNQVFLSHRSLSNCPWSFSWFPINPDLRWSHMEMESHPFSWLNFSTGIWRLIPSKFTHCCWLNAQKITYDHQQKDG